MIILLEGVDNLGKSTQAKKLFDYLNSKGKSTIIIPCSNFPAPKDNIKQANLDFNYDLIFSLGLISHADEFNIICDRSWLGEWIYGQMYRGYKAVEIFDYEFLLSQELVIPILFHDKIENLISRDDGKSFTVNKAKKQREIDLFFEAFSLTNFKNQVIINIEGKNENEVFSEIRTNINAIGKKYSYDI